MDKLMTVVIIGCGARGKDIYAKYQHRNPDKMRIVAAVEPNVNKLNEIREEYNIPKENCFTNSAELFKRGKIADVAFICTMDRIHYEDSVTALKMGYDLLLEKPISPLLSECREIERVAKENNRKVVVCHVLRYTVFYQQIKDLIEAGKIGDVVNIQAVEQVGYWHQAHSFVRGNWRSSDLSSPMILQKCCHDMDIYLWLIGKSARRVSSFGSLYEFKPENAPEGAAERCLDCKYKDTCIFSAPKYYLSELALDKDDKWPVNVLVSNPTPEKVLESLKTNQYGRCVYKCDNNVVDHQVVNVLLEDGVTLNFTMCAFTKECVRKLTVMGTRGEIEADMESLKIKFKPFYAENEVIDIKNLTNDFSGHSGGDMRMIDDMYALVKGIKTEAELRSITSIDKSMESHYLALAAEESRVDSGKVIELNDFINKH